MPRYIYTGTEPVIIDGIGIVKSGETITTETEINRPDFEIAKSKSQEKREKELNKDE